MRIMYVGTDKRTRVAEANRIKFLDGGSQSTDAVNEQQEGLNGPVLIAHTLRSKGGKRLTLSVPEGTDIDALMRRVLEQGWVDLSDFTVVNENQYA